ncbi:hypothetical protein EUX98_g8490 [Antrodiella citrinella]|uniref:Uncharacterized protein n=1 Tax=Antrodiella citrinella TaxID=2447956 RepID=A0A4S4M8W3_9APHY|nr:hypothetical protein EUX98_g8490 [Antrodiella citrinella]
MAEYSTLSPSSILRERSAYENDSESDDAITDTESSYSLPSAPLTPRPHRASHSRAVHFDTDDQFFCFRRTDIPPHCTKHFFAPAQDTEAAERIEASLSDDNSVVEDWSHEYVFTDSEDEVVDGVQLADVDDVLPPRPSTPSPRYSFTALNDTYCSSSDNDDAGGSSQMYLPSMEGADGFGSSSGCESEHSLESLPTEESERSLQTPTPISGEDVGVSLGNGNKGSDMVVDDMDEEERKMDEALEGMLRCFGEMKKPLKPLEDFYNSDSDADNDKKEQIAQARTFKRVPKFRDYGALARRRSPVMKTQDSSSASSTPTASGPGDAASFVPCHSFSSFHIWTFCDPDGQATNFSSPPPFTNGFFSICHADSSAYSSLLISPFRLRHKAFQIPLHALPGRRTPSSVLLRIQSFEYEDPVDGRDPEYEARRGVAPEQ